MTKSPLDSAIIPVPAVNALIVNEHGEVLLTRRSAEIREPGKWCLPGGHVDKGEKWLTALIREVQEEVGVEALNPKLFGVYSDPGLTVTQEPLREGYRVQYVVGCFLIREFRGKIKPNYEVDDWDWFLPENLPEPMIRSHPIRVHDGLSYKGVPFVR